MNSLVKSLSLWLLAPLLSIGALPVVASDPLDPIVLLSEFVGVDTVNPPGNEANAVAFYARYLKAAGIPFEAHESAPGRGNIWARLEGGDAPGLMLLQHTDVVPADSRYWDTSPLKAEIRSDYLYGRGVVDMKGTGIAQFLAFLKLAASKQPLTRDVVFMASADEEAGGFFGVDWIIKTHPEAFEGVGFLLNEGGSGRLNVQGDKVFAIEVTQKVPVWLKLMAEGEPGHGSYPRPESSVTKLLGALQNLQETPFPVRVIPAVDRYFKGLSAGMAETMRQSFAEVKTATESPEFVSQLHREMPALHALLRDTCSITMLKGSSKINVVPPVAEAEVDCRMLPDRPVEAFVEDFRSRVAGFGVEVSVSMAFSPAISDAGSDLVNSIKATLSARHPGATYTFSVASGFTDSHFTRDLGIQSYGFSPMLYLDNEARGVHGNNEAIHVERFRQSVVDYQAVVDAFVLKTPVLN